MDIGSISGLLNLIIYLLIGGLLIYVVYWILGMLSLPAEVRKVIMVIIAIIFLVWLLRSLGLI